MTLFFPLLTLITQLRLLVTLPEAELDVIKERVRASAAGYQQLLLRVIPTWSSFIVDVGGSTPAIIGSPLLDPKGNEGDTEHKQSLVTAFGRFLKAVPSKERPLVVVLDNVQWLDGDSRTLLRSASSNLTLTHYTLYILSFRDVVGASGVSSVVDNRPANYMPVVDIPVPNLKRSDTRKLIEAYVRMSSESEYDKLTDTLYSKTSGNPFFILQFLQYLVDGGALKFDRDIVKWRYSTGACNESGIPENVVDLLAQNLRRLPDKVLEVLSLAATYGQHFSTEGLKSLGVLPDEQIDTSLQVAWEAGFLSKAPLAGAPDTHYSFIHDQVRAAALQDADLMKHAGYHVAIARYLSDLPDNSDDRYIFQIARHYNEAIEAVHATGGKCELLSDLEPVLDANQRAANLAFTTGAYGALMSHAQKVFDLLPPGDQQWEMDYERHMHLNMLMLRGELQSKLYTEAQARITELYKWCKCFRDELELVVLHVSMLEMMGNGAEAIRVTKGPLEKLGFAFPENAFGTCAFRVRNRRLFYIVWVAHNVCRRWTLCLRARTPPLTRPSNRSAAFPAF